MFSLSKSQQSLTATAVPSTRQYTPIVTCTSISSMYIGDKVKDNIRANANTYAKDGSGPVNKYNLNILHS